MKKLITICLLGLAAYGCTPPTVKLTVIRPAEIDVPGVQTIAIGDFELVASEDYNLFADNRQWMGTTRLANKRPSLQAAEQVKAEIVNALAEVPHYNMVDTDEFNKVYNMSGIAALVGGSAFNKKQAQAVLFGQVWAGSTWMEMVEPTVEYLATWKVNWIKPPPIYDPMSGTQIELPAFPVPVKVASKPIVVNARREGVSTGMAVRFTLIRLVPKVEAVTTRTVILTNRNEEKIPYADGRLGVPNGYADVTTSPNISMVVRGKTIKSPDQLLGMMARKAVNQFIGLISPTKDSIYVEINTGGDPIAIGLLKNGSYEVAGRRLVNCLSNKVEGYTYGDEIAQAPDLYNLGLSFEARGPNFYEDAMQRYEQAMKRDLTDKRYSKAIGRLTTLMEEARKLESQRFKRDLGSMDTGG